MKFGAGIPLGLIGDDAIAVRDYAQGLEGAGIDYVTVGGHLLSAQPGSYPERPDAMYVGPYHEPFVLFTYMAACTERLHVMNSIYVLPAMQTALVAKLAAELSILSGGRYELGAGISWQPAEYQALGADLHTRGRRLIEQVRLLRRLWTEPFVTFEGRWHHLEGVGINRPVPHIPIWFGAGVSEPILRRTAKYADGWLPQGDPTEPVARLKEYLAEAGRDPSTFLLRGAVTAGPEGPDAWVEQARHLQEIGMTHISIGIPGTTAGRLIETLPKLSEARRVLGEALGS